MITDPLPVRFEGKSASDLYLASLESMASNSAKGYADRFRELVEDFYNARMENPHWSAETYAVSERDLRDLWALSLSYDRFLHAKGDSYPYPTTVGSYGDE